MKCGACQRDCRKTSLAHVAEPGGGMRRARVCGSCFDGALHIVASVTSVTRGVAEKDAERKEAKDIVAPAIKRLKGIVSGYRATTNRTSEVLEAKLEGLEQAIDILESGDFT